jgi:hypothetical protein
MEKQLQFFQQTEFLIIHANFWMMKIVALILIMPIEIRDCARDYN